jgi:hypothetical protein
VITHEKKGLVQRNFFKVGIEDFENSEGEEVK